LVNQGLSECLVSQRGGLMLSRFAPFLPVRPEYRLNSY
jgi:hypothetical protein